MLFDLDGTLADTAPDLIGAVQELRADLALAPIDPERVRYSIAAGGSAIVRAGLPERPDLHVEVVPRYLDLYRARIARETRLFPGMAQVLSALEHEGWRWGVVTNKAAWLTDPLIEALGMRTRAGVVVSGDTLPQRKPEPEPVWLACRTLDVLPAQAWFVGDDERDIVAGRRAGTRTVAVGYGYAGPEIDIGSWGADHRVEQAAELLELIGR